MTINIVLDFLQSLQFHHYLGATFISFGLTCGRWAWMGAK